MWALLSRRFRMWLLFAFGAPIAAWLLNAVINLLESGGSPTRLSSTLRKGRDVLHRYDRGPGSRGRRRRRGL